MKVSEIKKFPIQDNEGKSYFVIKIETDSGIYGLGEAGIRHGVELYLKQLTIFLKQL